MEDKYKKYKTKYLLLKNIENQIGGEKKLKKKHIDNNRNKLSYNKMDGKYILHLSEPWFTLISLGLKTVEGRKNKGIFKEMKVGDIIQWTNDDFDNRTVLTKIIKKVEYDTFSEYLNNEGLENCLPGMPSLEHGLSVYFKYYTKEDETNYGVIAIHLELIK
jgi:ASC-1-like (ASCH) protein